MEPLTDGFAELTLETPDPARLERFYVDALGLTVLAREDGRVWLAAGPTARRPPRCGATTGSPTTAPSASCSTS